MPKINCQKTAVKKIQAILCIAAKKGEPAFNAYKSAHNAFVGALGGLATATVSVIEPILLIDELVLETFVRPPLELAQTAGEVATKAYKISLKIFSGGNDGEPKCADYNSKLRNSTNSLVKLTKTRDLAKLTNWISSYEESITDRKELIEDFKELSNSMTGLEVNASHQEFVDTICKNLKDSV